MNYSRRYISLLILVLAVTLFLTLLASWSTPEPAERLSVSHTPEERQEPARVRRKDVFHHGPQHLINKLQFHDLAAFDFSLCQMDICFDFSRCQKPGPMRVGIVPSKQSISKATNATLGESDVIHAKILEIVKNSIYFEPDLNNACVFILEDNTLDRDPLSQSFRPDLQGIFDRDTNFGMNHLIFNLYSGTWPSYREDDFSGLQFGAAIVAKASNSVARHRKNFDISLPLFSYLHPDTDSDREDINIPNSQHRTLLLSFKGKRYVYGNGSETRNSIYHIDNHRDIMMLTTCKHGKKWRESSDSRCVLDNSRYEEFDYVELMRNSKFCLVPRGRRLDSFRFLEALSFGCIPVVLSDGWIKPFDETIDWSEALLQYDEGELFVVGDLLRDYSEAKVDAMRQLGLRTYRQHLSTKERIILTTLASIERRITIALEET